MALRWLASWFEREHRQRRQRRIRRQRIVRYFDCTWPSPWGTEQARVSSLGPKGCYIECRCSVPPPGTIIRDLTIALPAGSLTVQGIVIDAMRGIGFAVRFTDLDAGTRDRLRALVETGQPGPAPRP